MGAFGVGCGSSDSSPGGGGGGEDDAGADAANDTSSDATSEAECTTASQCPQATALCEVATCNGGVCGIGPAPGDTVLPDDQQTPHDCKRVTCGTGGTHATVADPTDLPEGDGSGCSHADCDGANPIQRPSAAGDPCDAVDGGADAGAGRVCNGAGVCGDCLPNAVECAGRRPRTCGADGTWSSGNPCPYVCANGECTGECLPGSVSCSGTQPRLCGSDGTWAASGAACSGGTPVCVGGSCQGSCTSGTTQCDGLSVQTCTGGQWITDPTPCPFACDQGACTGTCHSGDKRCNAKSVEVCDQTGSWAATTTCPFACSNGSCTGSCADGDKQCLGVTPELCVSNQWTTDLPCPFVCAAGVCTGVCSPNSTQCAADGVQTCSSSGQWVTTTSCATCVGGVCTGSCSNGSVQCTGNTVQTCVGGAWTDGITCAVACSAGACVGGDAGTDATPYDVVGDTVIVPDVDYCNDGLLNAGETTIDCGGPICGACNLGKACLIDRDCISKNCYQFVCTAITGTCSDGTQNGAESDVDCGGGSFDGGAACPRCATNKKCTQPGDCVSGDVCLGGLCKVPGCSDGIRDGNETDIDCGGAAYNGAAACSKCPTGKACYANTDCSSNACDTVADGGGAGSFKCL